MSTVSCVGAISILVHLLLKDQRIDDAFKT